jgi:phospholipase/carboxylesterase
VTGSHEAVAHLIRPAAGSPSGAIVLFHGRGADQHDLVPLFDLLDPEQRLVGVTPRGPLALPPGGAHWYAVQQIGYPDPETFRETYAAVSAWLDALPEALGVPLGRTVLGGFSQGAVMSYALGLGRGRPTPAGIVALSGFMPTVDGLALDLDRAGLRTAIGHGTHDPVIGVEWSRRARDELEAAGVEVVYRESPLPHAIDPRFLVDLRGWLGQALADAAQASGSPY